MRYINRTAGWLTVAGILFLVSAISAFAEDPVITVKKAADVNGVTITMMTLNSEFRQVLKQQGLSEDAIPADQVGEYKKEILDSLINQELLYQESQKNQIRVDEEDVNSTVLKAKGSFETEEAYQAALKDANMQEGDLNERIRKTLAINQLVEEKISQQVDVTDEDAKAYYDSNPESFQRTEKVRASHILIKVDRDAGEAKKVAAKEKIKNLQRRVREGEDFAELAKENSECPSSENGGELGYFERGKMVQEFEEAAFSTAVGSISDVVQTDYGYHLVKVTDKIEPGVIAFETVKDDLKDFMLQQKVQVAVSAFLDSLKNDAEIEMYL
jgi:peptidyl-prolyl cis-trans isomerase C